MTTAKRKPKIYIATESFVTDVNGVPTHFNAGRTRVREGHEVLTRAPNYFEEIDVDTHDVEAATAGPGEYR